MYGFATDTKLVYIVIIHSYGGLHMDGMMCVPLSVRDGRLSPIRPKGHICGYVMPSVIVVESAHLFIMAWVAYWVAWFGNLILHSCHRTRIIHGLLMGVSSPIMYCYHSWFKLVAWCALMLLTS